MGKVVVFAVGFAILSFVAADLLGPQSVLFGQGQQLVAEIKGEKISYPEFINEIEKLKTVFFVNNQKTPSAEEVEGLRQQAWNNMMLKYGYQVQYDQLGIVVTDDEMVDMVQGSNIHPAVQNAFTNPETGVFDRSRLVAYLQNLGSMEAIYQQQWLDFEKSLRPERRLSKLTALMGKSVYSTKYDKQREYVRNNAKVSGEYLYIPYFSIADSLVEINDSDLEAVLNERKEEFKLTDNVTFDYVSFQIVPSAEDSAYYREEMVEIFEEFGQEDDDSSFIKLRSDESLLPTFYSPDAIPTAIADTIGSLKVGDVVGPFEEAGGIKIYKLIAQGSDSSGQFVKASHILINTENRTDDEAKSIANRILSQALAGQDFATLARQNSDGPSGPNGGELGWFGRGRMVSEFEEAAFSMKSAGVVPNIVKTQFGYHIINVTQAATDSNYLIGTITRTITASDDTRDEIFRKADYFAGTSTSSEEFEANAAEEGMNIVTARGIGKNDKLVNGISNVSQVIRWGFSEADPGDVSQVFELDNQYMVCRLNSIQEEGYADVEDVEERLKPYALKKAKAAMLGERLAQLPEQESLEEMSKAFGSEAKYYSVSSTFFNSNSLTGVGFDPKAVGVLFGLLEGSKSGIIEGENGIMIMKTTQLTPAPGGEAVPENTTGYLAAYQGRAGLGVSETIREDADVVDNRYKFF